MHTFLVCIFFIGGDSMINLSNKINIKNIGKKSIGFEMLFLTLFNDSVSKNTLVKGLLNKGESL